MTPYIYLGDKQQATKSDLAAALQDALDLLSSEGVSTESLVTILTDNNVTHEL